jgi:DNA-binding IscR family transcriptional regulator
MALLSKPGLSTTDDDAASDQSFNEALRIVLTVGVNQRQSLLTSRRQIRSINGVLRDHADIVLAQLIFANILSGDENGYRLARSPKAISLAEIYAAVIPARKLPKTTFDRFYETIAEKARDAAMAELAGLDLSSTLAKLFASEEKLRKFLANDNH